MALESSLVELLIRLWGHLGLRRRWQLLGLILLMVIAALSEALSIGALIPFLTLLTDPNFVTKYPEITFVVNEFGFSNNSQLLLIITFSFCTVVILAGALRLLLMWTSTRFSFSVGADFSNDIYLKTLTQPYEVHITRNSSEVINGIVTKVVNVIYGVIIPATNLASAFFLLFFIIGTLLYINPTVALTTLLGFGFIYLLIIGVSKKFLLENSVIIARESSLLIKSIQEGLGGIRDVLIDGTQSAYCDIYRKSDRALRGAQASTQFIALGPRYAIEALCVLLIVFIAYEISVESGDLSLAIPILGALAFGAQRMLPVLQQTYSAWTSIQGTQISLRDTLGLLDQKLPPYFESGRGVPVDFDKLIELRNLTFQYGSNSALVLHDLNIAIPKGGRVGFIGKTGSGKSTLIDVIMGLLHPTAGALCVDGVPINDENRRGWQSHIAHVPQFIFLADTSIEENIAFGVPRALIDKERVVNAARQAQISELIDGWKEKYQTIVGEQGIFLSGGQRQRVGIARALYKNADVIIFDEATSALDGETEEAVMNAIEELNSDLTILIIAHRLTTLKNCSQIFELKSGGVIEQISK